MVNNYCQLVEHRKRGPLDITYSNPQFRIMFELKECSYHFILTIQVDNNCL